MLIQIYFSRSAYTLLELQHQSGLLLFIHMQSHDMCPRCNLIFRTEQLTNKMTFLKKIPSCPWAIKLSFFRVTNGNQ
jgi:hypothetical protein